MPVAEEIQPCLARLGWANSTVENLEDSTMSSRTPTEEPREGRGGSIPATELPAEDSAPREYPLLSGTWSDTDRESIGLCDFCDCFRFLMLAMFDIFAFSFC